MVNELFQTNHDLEKLNEEIFSQHREHSRIMSNYNELEAELEQANNVPLKSPLKIDKKCKEKICIF